MRVHKGGTAAGLGKVYVLDPARMEIGDIVLNTDPRSRLSHLARLRKGGDYSHAAIYTRTGLMMEAGYSKNSVGGVRRASTMRVLAENSAYLRVLRLRRSVRTRRTIAEKAAAGAEWMMDRPYWMEGARSLLVRITSGKIPPNPDAAFFCSHLVAAMYKRAGLDLLPGIPPQRTVPSAFLRSPKLVDVTGKVITAEDAEMARAYAPKKDHSPHIQIEQKVNQQILSDPSVVQIVRRYRKRRPPGYHDLLNILEETRDQKLDLIAASGVEKIADGFRNAWNGSESGHDPFRRFKELFLSGTLPTAKIQALVRVLRRVRLILGQHVKERENDVRKIAERARTVGRLETFERLLSFSRELLEHERLHLATVDLEIGVLSFELLRRDGFVRLWRDAHNCMLLLEPPALTPRGRQGSWTAWSMIGSG
jgi:hypothetical protein